MNEEKSSYSYNSDFLLKNGKPWFPVMGELHYSRYPKKLWPEALAKMKAGGVTIVSSYIFWIHHEEKKGEYDFTGNRDLRGFLHAVRDAGLPVFLRIGPWCHGEVRNGGLPDWIMEKDYEPRTNDKGYLEEVKTYFAVLAEQIRGLLWEDGGPVIGIQIENEYGCCGGLDGEEGEAHMRILKKLALDAGLKAPYMTATGWGGAHTAGLLPVMGGYCDAPWDRSLEKLPPNGNYVFTPERDDSNIGSDFGKKETARTANGNYPYLTAELGGGLQPTRHRRPVPSASDTGAMSLVKLGCGANLLGYYMYHGGTNPKGKYSSLQETKAAGSWNDLPEYNYDFNAPVGEYGQVRESFREIKLLALFLQDFGEELCAMKPRFPEPLMDNAEDLQTLRTCVREKDGRGYLFVNNHQRLYPMKNHAQVSLKVKAGEEELCFPAENVRDGDYFFYPFHMPVGDHAEIVTAMASPLCVLRRRKGNIYVFYSDTDPQYRIKGDMGDNRIVTLTRREALDAWKTELQGEDYLLFTSGVIREQEGKVLFSRTFTEQEETAAFYAFPELPLVPEGFQKVAGEGLTRYEIRVNRERKAGISWKETGKGERFREYELFLDYPENTGGKECFLEITYDGESAYMEKGGEICADHFYTGQPWYIGMGHLGFPVSTKIRVNALEENAPLYLEQWPDMVQGKADTLKEVKILEEYEFPLWEKEEESRFLAPFSGQGLTDIALHFKWTKEKGSRAVEYILEMADNEEFSGARQMEAVILEDSEVGYYFPRKEELPSHGGRWFARVREKAGDRWSRTADFCIDMEHGRRPVKRRINAQNPWFTVFDYSEHEPAEVWEMLPEDLKAYTGMGLIASYKAKADQVIRYMMDEDAKGYLWHLGALGPHETQFGKYCITSLCEIEYVMQHSRNLVSTGFVEQYLGTKDEVYWRNEYFFRLLALCAKYGIPFIYSDGNRNNLELAAMIKRPFFMDKMREYSDYFIFSFKQNHAHGAYSCFGAILGAWMDGACCEIGVQPENWYWNDAGFRDRPGECHGYLQGNEQQITACMTAEMLLTGLSIGAAHYSCEGESWLIERGTDGRLAWSAQGTAALSLFRAIVSHKLIPDKQEVLNKIHMAVDYEGWSPEELGDAWTGGILREVFEPVYHIRNGFELMPKESRFFYLPLVTDRRDVFKGMEKLKAGEMDREEAQIFLSVAYQETGYGNAYYAVYPELIIVMNSRENEEESQWFCIPGGDDFLMRMQGALSLWQYIVVKKKDRGYLFHVNMEKGKNLCFRLYFSHRPVWTETSDQVNILWQDDFLEIHVQGDGNPVEFGAADMQEHLPRPEQAVRNPAPEETILLSDLPWSVLEAADGCVPQKDACADTVFGRLPLAVDHLRYSRGLSMGNKTRITWDLDGQYRRLSFWYGFDMDAWMPKILDRETIIWDRADKSISMRVRLFGDGKELFCSPELTSTGGVHEGEADLQGINRLELVVDGAVVSEDPEARVYLDILNPVLAL